MATIELKPVETKKPRKYGGEIVKSKGRKAGEDACRGAFAFTTVALHKFSDVRVCYKCNAVIPKAEDQPDYLGSIDWFYVEAKETDAQGYFKWRDKRGGFTDVQRRRLAEHEGYVFILMRDVNGRAPEGASAYCIPWQDWLEVEARLELMDISSVRRVSTKRLPGLDDGEGISHLLIPHKCRWIPGTKHFDGHWELPEELRSNLWERYRKAQRKSYPLQGRIMTYMSRPRGSLPQAEHPLG
jgi:hypothetical protein